MSSKPADDLIFLEKCFSDRTKVAPEVIPLVVLLVTPSRLELLNDNSNFIPKLLTLLFNSPNEVPKLDVLVAVIDKIPYPRPSELPDWKDKFQQKDGCEGISFMVGESEELAPDLWTARDWAGRQGKTAVGQPSALSFRLKPNAQTMDSIAARNSKGSEASYEFQLPLANTLFHNGQVSTLYAERWVSTESTNDLSRVRRNSLPQQTLHIYREAQIKLDMMLNPIVPPRIIAAAMGNIIRQFYTSSDSNPQVTVPASKELEVAVSRYIELSQDHTQKTDIWALVTPREYIKSGPWEWNNPQKLFENGSRLHKVLSGGGGWGIKEGLLALDPDCDYNYPEHDTEMDFGVDSTKDFEGAQSCRNIVRPGDQVAFLAPTPLVEPRRSGSEPSECLSSWVLNTSSLAVFGTLPSTLDAIPESDSASCQPSLPFNHLLARNHLGVLSENGMSIKIHNDGFDDTEKMGAEKHGLVVQTKLDAPYALYSAVAPRLEHLQKENVEIRKDIVKTASDAKRGVDMGDQPNLEDRLDARLTMLNMMNVPAQVLDIPTEEDRTGMSARSLRGKNRKAPNPKIISVDERQPIDTANRIRIQYVPFEPIEIANRPRSRFNEKTPVHERPVLQPIDTANRIRYVPVDNRPILQPDIADGTRRFNKATSVYERPVLQPINIERFNKVSPVDERPVLQPIDIENRTRSRFNEKTPVDERPVLQPIDTANRIRIQYVPVDDRPILQSDIADRTRSRFNEVTPVHERPVLQPINIKRFNEVSPVDDRPVLQPIDIANQRGSQFSETIPLDKRTWSQRRFRPSLQSAPTGGRIIGGQWRLEPQSQPATKQGDRRAPDAVVNPHIKLSSNQGTLRLILQPTPIGDREGPN
ncbi:hypothetical protein MMC07_003033 [Pseudocyphellaria aurata]|nr:hypothetical protein [Pseudocyphellaria aurata]